jgi:hypothetical protein
MTEQNPGAKKGKATPPRKQQEAARKRPLVGARTKEARKAAADKARAERLAAREGYAAGDDRFLPKRDKGPQRRFVRDVVDARWLTIGELLLPTMIVTIFITPGSELATAISALMSALVLALFILFLVESVFIARRAKKLLTAKFGAEKVEKGIWSYVAFRAMYPRFVRLPKAQVPRGHKF